MEEITPEHSEEILRAAARGDVASVHLPIGEALIELHALPEMTTLTEAPAVAASEGARFTLRIARRTAVAAVVAMLGLAGVAAAATVGVELLVPSSVSPTFVPPVEEADEEARESVPVEEIEGVDPSDGLDDEELTILCEAVDNHGQHVSSVARDKITEHDDNHGQRTREAAGSDCGRSDDDGDGDDGDDDAGHGHGHGKIDESEPDED